MDAKLKGLLLEVYCCLNNIEGDEKDAYLQSTARHCMEEIEEYIENEHGVQEFDQFEAEFFDTLSE